MTRSPLFLKSVDLWVPALLTVSFPFLPGSCLSFSYVVHLFQARSFLPRFYHFQTHLQLQPFAHPASVSGISESSILEAPLDAPSSGPSLNQAKKSLGQGWQNTISGPYSALCLFFFFQFYSSACFYTQSFVGTHHTHCLCIVCGCLTHYNSELPKGNIFPPLL